MAIEIPQCDTLNCYVSIRTALRFAFGEQDNKKSKNKCVKKATCIDDVNENFQRPSNYSDRPLLVAVDWETLLPLFPPCSAARLSR
jgi:hypothetical protein